MDGRSGRCFQRAPLQHSDDFAAHDFQQNPRAAPVVHTQHFADETHKGTIDNTDALARDQIPAELTVAMVIDVIQERLNNANRRRSRPLIGGQKSRNADRAIDAALAMPIRVEANEEITGKDGGPDFPVPPRMPDSL